MSDGRILRAQELLDNLSAVQEAGRWRAVSLLDGDRVYLPFEGATELTALARARDWLYRVIDGDRV